MQWADASAWMGRRVLVTGASGFLGHAVCELLLECGAEVHGGYRSRPPPEGVTGHHAVLPEDAAGLLRAADPEVVLHLASPVAHGPDAAQYEALRRGILDSTVLIADECRRRGIRLVHVGTCAEYGEGEPPFSEDAPLRPASPYAALKAAATHWVLAQVRGAGLSACVVRPFRAYGPRDLSSVLSLAFRAALTGADLPLTDGAQVREWNDVYAIAHGILAAGAHPGAVGEVVNLGGGPRASVREAAETIFALAEADPSKLRFGRVPRRPGEAERFWSDPSRAEALWGPLPQPPLAQGLADALEWYREAAAEWMAEAPG